MAFSRRSFLSESAALGAVGSLLAHPHLAEAIDINSLHPPGPPTAGEMYWKNLYAGSAERSRGGSKSANPDRDPRIAQYDDKAGLRWAQDIKPTELPSFPDDAVITLELTGFRAGTQDKSQLAKVRFAQLHLSCQRVTGSEFLGPIVWAALATLFANKATLLPTEQDLTWSALSGKSTSQAQPKMTNGPQLTHVVLNQGAGHMSINVTTAPTNSLLDRILGVTIQATRIMTPLLGFPGIALPALQNFYTFYGLLESSRPENFLLNSDQQDVVVTQQGADSSLISANALKLVSGTYILVPEAQENDFEKAMSDLVVQNGYLVEPNSKAAPDQRIAEAIPTVSYVSLNVKVQPASAFPATDTVTDPMLDSAPVAKPSTSTTSTEKKPN